MTNNSKSIPFRKSYVNKIRGLANKIDRILRLQQGQGSIYIGNNQALARLYSGQKLYVDTRDTSITPHLLLDGAWEQGLSNRFLSLIRPDDVVVDVGADFGYYGVIAASKLSSKGFVIFAEANPIYKDYIAKNIALNGLCDKSYYASNVISDTSGRQIKFRRLKHDWASSSAMSDKEFKATRSIDYLVEDFISVKTITLDEVIKTAGIKSVGIIKMDIEGYEERAIKGMKSIIKNSTDLRLIVEFTIPAYKNPAKLYDELESQLPHVYLIDEIDGSLRKIRHFKELTKQQNILLFSVKEQQL